MKFPNLRDYPVVALDTETTGLNKYTKDVCNDERKCANCYSGQGPCLVPNITTPLSGLPELELLVERMLPHALVFAETKEHIDHARKLALIKLRAAIDAMKETSHEN